MTFPVLVQKRQPDGEPQLAITLDWTCRNKHGPVRLAIARVDGPAGRFIVIDREFDRVMLPRVRRKQLTVVGGRMTPTHNVFPHRNAKIGEDEVARAPRSLLRQALVRERLQAEGGDRSL